jgi:two-component system sensor histidine kinase RegB
MPERDPVPGTSTAGAEQASHVVMPWLIRLRWASVAALAAAAFGADVFWGVRLPLLPLGLLLAALAATNAALTFQITSPSPRRGVIGAAILADVGLLTWILYLVGGPLNPFSVVFLVEITLAAVMLGHRWATGVAVLSIAAYGLTFYRYRPLEFTDSASTQHVLTLHLAGMWVAFVAAAILIAHFVSRVSEALDRRSRELAAARTAAARGERLAALLSLGAGAAHELATPLSTIRTAAGELERTISAGSEPAVRDYVAIIRGEIDRCTIVLDQLSGRASAASAADSQIDVPQLVEDVRYRLGETLSQRLRVAAPAAVRPINAPAEPLRQTLVAILRNAFDASPADRHVSLRIDQSEGTRIEVVDRGHGMDGAQLARAGEPFFTTKPPGGGVGLGLFLARAFADQIGGRLQLHSTPGEGTSVVLELPGR